MATPTKDARFKYTVVTPDGKRYSRGGSASGVVQSRRWLVDTLLHGQPVGSQIEDLREVGVNGEEIPLDEQPTFYTEEIEPRREAPNPRAVPFHPGVERPRPEEGSVMAETELKEGKLDAAAPRMPKNPDVLTGPGDADKTEQAKVAGKLAQQRTE